MITKRKFTRFISYISIVFVFSCLIINFSPSLKALAHSDDTIVIGYIDYKGYIERNDNGEFFGYGVDYLNEISKYTGWKYKYVYGTWDELMNKVLDGEVDFLCHAQYSEERAKRYDFSKYSIGVETAVIYVPDDNTKYHYNDFESFTNMKIGVLKGSYQTEILRSYAKDKFSYKEVEYTSEEDAFKALDDGKIDAVSMGSLAYRSGFKVVCNFGANPFYFITSKSNNEKLDEMNRALDEIKNNKYDFESELYKKYYGDSVVEGEVHFTKEEQKFINKKKTITVGNLPNRHPISSYNSKTGELSGINESIMELISKKSGLIFDLKPLEIGEKPLAALKDKKFDLVCGVCITDNFLNDKEISLTNSFF